MTDKAMVTDAERAWNAISDDLNRWDMLSEEERETFTAFAAALAQAEQPVAWALMHPDDPERILKTEHSALSAKFMAEENKTCEVRALVYASPSRIEAGENTAETHPPPGSHLSLSIAALQRAHVERQEEWCPDQKPDLSFRGNELGGECGEAQNVIKKLERERHGWRGSRDTVEHLAEELADVIHCAVLVAITAGIEIEPAVIAKFNSTSDKNGLSTFLATTEGSDNG